MVPKTDILKINALCVTKRFDVLKSHIRITFVRSFVFMIFNKNKYDCR